MSSEMNDSRDRLQRALQPDAPFPENGLNGADSSSAADPAVSTPDGLNVAPSEASTAETVACARCLTLNPPGAGTCQHCQSFLPSNQVARTSGVYARELPPDLRERIEELRANITSDRGGDTELSTLDRWYIQKLCRLDAVIQLIEHEADTRGWFTRSGRPRALLDKLQSLLLTADRFAQRVGQKRQPKHINPVSNVRDAVAKANLPPESHDHK
jgi:hypothetical protein